MYHLIDAFNGEVLREYQDLDSAIADLAYKAPEAFWVGVTEERQAYTIPDFFEKFVNNGDKS